VSIPELTPEEKNGQKKDQEGEGGGIFDRRRGKQDGCAGGRRKNDLGPQNKTQRGSMAETKKGLLTALGRRRGE